MANLFICPFKHEKVSAEGYLAGDSIQRFRRRLETVKESGICWFEPNNGHQQGREESIRRGMFPVKICEIHSLGRYSREVFIGAPPPIAPQKWTRGKWRKISDPLRAGVVPVAA